jgi:hypothetical protein
MLVNDLPVCDTIEKEWLDNKPKISCIPDGVYEYTSYNSPSKGYEVFLLKKVPKRSFIEIHIANWESDLLGCIGPGQGYITAGGKTGVANSTHTFKHLRKILPKEGKVIIVNKF